ncbi:fatty acid synthase alpha subunit Lsd1, partial [Coemansia sp. BCRC 34301]
MLTDEQSVYDIGKKILGIQMLTGVIPQRNHPCPRLPLTTTEPRPTVSVQGITQPALEHHISRFNSQQTSSDQHMYISVINTTHHFIVTGHINSAVAFVASLSELREDSDQPRVPFAERKPTITFQYMSIPVPYHCPLLEPLVDTVYNTVVDKGWGLRADDMQIAVRAADDGHNIREEPDLTMYLLRSMLVLPVNWPLVTRCPNITHIVDFGPGGFSGFGMMAYRNVEGMGVPVICAGALVSRSSKPYLGSKADLYKTDLADVTAVPNWLAEFGPKLVRTAYDGELHIDTPMSRVLGAPTVMVAGMTPTTVSENFVAAINNAGYHVELAGGGIHNESDLESKIGNLIKLARPGQGITLNCIYVDQRQWSFQFPALLRLRAKGVPIAGLCIGGGVPSFDSATTIIDSLHSAGIRYVAFKPSTAEAIRHVANIAKAHNDFPVMLQWTGGRAGGHHSFEDFHQPVLETYTLVRACRNIVLVAGSGFGDAEGSLPYLTGDWSVAFGRAPMPFDGILLGSRVMVAKEAGTSQAAKELIVAAPGLSDAEWHKTYNGPSGGVMTVTSEYGELNHVIATQAMLFVTDLRSTILSQPREKHAALLLARKDEIIARLNSDYCRPWFGCKADGHVVDLEDMTYAEVIGRLVELMYVKSQQRWIHKSYRQLVFDFVVRAECRLGFDLPEMSMVSDLQLVNPTDLARSFTARYAAAESQLLHSEDIQFFVSICKRRGQKPVPFIPVLDSDFSVLLLKDSIWQSEDLSAVVDQDPQRVAIQQGPVAAQYSSIVNEPVKDILDGVYHGHIAALLSRGYSGDAESVPVVEYFGVEPQSTTLPASVIELVTNTTRTYQLPSTQDQLPAHNEWLEVLAGPTKSWLRALLTAPVIVEGSDYVDNYVQRVLRPRPGQVVTVCTDNDCQPLSVSIANSQGEAGLLLEHPGKSIELKIFQPTLSGPATLLYRFVYQPAQPLTPIHLVAEGHDNRIRRCYGETWIDNSDEPSEFEDHANPDAFLLGTGFKITEDHVYDVCQIVGNSSQHYLCPTSSGLRAPMEFYYYAATPSIMRILSSTVFAGGQLSVVHLYNKIELVDGTTPLMVGDTVSSSLRVEEITNSASGKALKILGQLRRGGKLVAQIETAFLSRNTAARVEDTFRRAQGQQFTIRLATANDVVALRAKEWFIPRNDDSALLAPGSQLQFSLDSLYHFQSNDIYSSILTTGRVFIKPALGQSEHIADVLFESGALPKDPVVEYLRRHEATSVSLLANGDGYSLVVADNQDLMLVTVPDSNMEYARVSADDNPIHTNLYFADIAGLPGPITHGLWTSASTRALVECYAANDEPERIRMYQTDFLEMVLPKDQLQTKLFHVGMKGGRMLVKGVTSKIGGGPVLECSAEIEQPATAYIFTGQGSQEVGMGMGLYRQSAAARDIWDRADRHMVAKYGVSLLKIVRTNPKELTVHFCSNTGEELQRSYMSLTRRCGGDADAALPLLPDITLGSLSYTYRSPTGLLNSTQFAQVALITFAVAAVADMRAKSLVQKGAAFTGHSLGEYAALVVLSDIFLFEDVLDIGFFRGMLMQSAVERDTRGYSQYGMVAVDPSRLGHTTEESVLVLAVKCIHKHCEKLLEIVNYNVRGSQYVVAGTLRQLAALRLVLDAVATQGAPTDGDWQVHIAQIASSVLATPIDSRPVRGKATIPLPGIDVPFHSSQLLPSIDEFRALLQVKILPENIDYSALHLRYIPNLTAVPFEVSREYFSLVHGITQSPVAASVLDGWTDTAMDSADKVASLAATLLVELLAYQFASPVQWIDTQDVLFGKLGVRRLVEIGASPVLSSMATKTLKSKAYANKQVDVLHIERDRDSVYYTQQRQEMAEPTPIALPVQTEQVAMPVVEPVLPAVAPSVVTEASNSAKAAPLVDATLQALDVVHAVVAHKTKRSLADISTFKSIKTLVSGKSTLQNEIVGDLHKEFGSK